MNEEYMALTNYYFYISKKEKEQLERYHKNYKHLLDKQKDSFSAFIRLVIKNTYLYMSNLETNLDYEIDKLMSNSGYSSLSYTFKKELKSAKGKELIRELLRNQVLKTYQKVELGDEETLEKQQFRLTREDEVLFKAMMSNVSFTNPDYLTLLIRYFLSADSRYILNYANLRLIDFARKENYYVYIRQRKYKILASKEVFYPFHDKELLIEEANHHKIKTIRCRFFMEEKIDMLFEKYGLSEDENKIIDTYNNLSDINISYHLNTEEEIFLLTRNLKISEPSSFFKREQNGDDYKITVKYSDDIFRRFKIYESRGFITNLVFSKNYLNYLSLIEEFNK